MILKETTADSVTVKSSRTRERNAAFYRRPCRSVAYVDSNATDCIDKFFEEKKIYSLDFKCKTWTKMGTAAHKINVAALKTIFGESAEIRYSRKAGCSCGCSPGYIVNKIPATQQELRGKDVWIDIKSSRVSEIEAKLPLFAKMLKDEIATSKV